MAREIEHQFLLGELGRDVLDRAERVRRIRQAYLTRVGPAIRVRWIDGETLMTVKSGGGLVREEVEFPIEHEVADALFRIGEGALIEKTRYVLGRWELDVFHGRHEGLYLGEVELESVDEVVPPVPEGVQIVADLTHEGGFNNQFLASLGVDEAQSLVRALTLDPAAALDAVRGGAYGRE